MTVTQAMVRMSAADKRRALRHLIKSEDVKNALIFCNRKRDVALVHKSLVSYGLDAGALHGDMVQSARSETLAKFKADELRLMVCSDVAARGIDIKGLSHVFNFDVPTHAEDYVHRIGRTGRAGMSGRAFMFVTPDDAKFLSGIEKLIGNPIPEITLEGFDSEPADATSERPAEGERRPARSRSPRKPRSEAKNEPREEQPLEEAVAAPQVSETPAAAPRSRAPRESTRSRPEPRQRPQESRAPESRQRSPEPRGRSSEPRQRYWSDDDDGAKPVVGFGDQIPAFLRVAPRRPRD